MEDEPIDEKLRLQIAAARRRGKESERNGFLARSVKYDKRTHRFLLELTNGVLLGVPVASLPRLATATPLQLSRVELSPAGGGLHFEELDEDYSVPGIVMASVGRPVLAKAFGRAGGSATSAAKAKASRANGAKGGRPTKAKAKAR